MQGFTAAPHHDVLALVIQIALLLFVARALGEVAQRFRQPAVVGEILAGIILGPSLLSGIFPEVAHWVVPQSEVQGYLLEVVSLFGAMFLLLITGLETDLQLIRRQARAALGASLGGILVPFATGYILGLYIPDDLLANPERPIVFALFLATAMSISAIPVIAKVLMDLNLMRRDVGQAIIAAGMTDDAIGWMMLSVVLGLASGTGGDVMDVFWAVGKVVGFMVISFTLGRWLVRHTLSYVQDRAVSNHRILSLVVIMTFGWGALSLGLGLEAMLGAFVMGILFGQMPRLPSQVFHGVEQMAMAIFAPVFFAVAGLKVNIRTLADPRLIVITLIVIAVASFGKVVGGYAGARLVGRRDHWTALSFGVGMNARGAMEIIIATIGLSMGLLTQEMFSIIVVMAITTSVLAPPALRWTLSHVQPGKQELERLRREELAETSLIAGVRRALVPVRCRGNESGALFRLEGELLEQMRARNAVAVTLFAVIEECDREESERFLDRVATGFPDVELTRKIVTGYDIAKLILEEAEKDYDLLILGAPAADGKRELFDPMVDYLMRMSPCPTMVVKGRLSEQNWPPSKILLPTNGSAASRAAADVAFALGIGDDREVLVLNVVEGREGGRRLDLTGQELRTQMDSARAIVDQLCEMGEALGVRTSTEVRVAQSAESVVLELARDGIDLIVLGTDLRPASDRLFLGPKVERVLTDAACPVVVMNAS